MEDEVCVYCKDNPNNCNDIHPYYLAGSVVSILGSLFVMVTYIRNPFLRKHPSVLIFSRSSWDLVFALNFIVIYIVASASPSDLPCDKRLCQGMAFWLMFALSASLGYYACNVFDVYTSMNNPFTKPTANISLYHRGVWLYAAIVTIVLTSSDKLGWRNDLQICWIRKENQTGYNWVAIVFGYIPISCVTLCAVYVSISARNRLQKGLPDTFDIRMKALTDGVFYTVSFTIYFVILWLWYFLVWVSEKEAGDPSSQIPPQKAHTFLVLFGVTVGSLGVVDFLLWFWRKWYYDLAPEQRRSRFLACKSRLCCKNSNENQTNNENEHVEANLIAEQNRPNNNSIRTELAPSVLGVGDPVRSNSARGSRNVSAEKTASPRYPPKPSQSHKEGPSKRSLLQDISVTQLKDDEHTINKALRREVLAFTTDGIAQSVDRAKQLARKTGILATTVPSHNLYPENINDPSDLATSRFGLRIRYNSELLFGTSNSAVISSAPTFLPASSPADDNAPIEALVPNTAEEKEAKAEREFTDFAPLVFRFLRRRLLDLTEPDYMASIIPPSAAQQRDVLDAKFGEGRSGAFFYFTHDSRFLVKTITKAECEFFISILKKYVEFLHDNPDSALNLFLGLHSCRMYNLTLYFVVMENIFLADLKPHEVYDLKGSWVARHTHAGINSGKVMKDMDLNRYIVLSKESRVKILNQLEKDSLFLRDIGIMDYSLLLGIYYMQIAHNPIRDSKGFLHQPKSKENKGSQSDTKETEHLLNEFHGGVRAQVIEGPGIYYIGIIDILQKWNISKKIEHYFKCWVLRHPAAGISCVDPHFYQQRFINYMRQIMITDEEFLELNSISTEMFRQATVFQYPAPEVVDDSFRAGRISIIAENQATDVNHEHKNEDENHLNPRSTISVSVRNNDVQNRFVQGSTQPTSFRHTYRLHRGNSALNPQAREDPALSSVQESLGNRKATNDELDEEEAVRHIQFEKMPLTKEETQIITSIELQKEAQPKTSEKESEPPKESPKESPTEIPKETSNETPKEPASTENIGNTETDINNTANNYEQNITQQQENGTSNESIEP